MILFYRNPILWILLALIFFVGIALFFSSILTPYICSLILAYLLSPLVDRLENFGLPRAVSGLIILIFAIGVIILSILLVLPIFIEQFEELISTLPAIYHHCLIALDNLLPKFITQSFSLNNNFLDIKELFKNNGLNLASVFTSYAFALFDFIVITLIVPIISFYLLIDWNRIKAKCANYLPRNSSEEISDIMLRIDSLLSRFVRGQLLICGVLALFYSVLLSLLGLSYGLLIGVFAGMISFIPFLGSVLGATIAVTVAIYQFWETPSFIAYVGLVFIIGQLLESNYFTPKLIGNAVRLHPVVMMLSLSIGGAVAGLTGVLLAVPLTGILAVLLRRLGHRYLNSPFFKGTE
tara:strand:- start:68 stop:1120 length:1053 start_codon:yes stop_codon:yes gene_type:complete